MSNTSKDIHDTVNDAAKASSPLAQYQRQHVQEVPMEQRGSPWNNPLHNAGDDVKNSPRLPPPLTEQELADLDRYPF